MQRDQGSFCLFEHSYVTTSIIKGKAKLNSFREFWKHKKVLQFSCVLGSSLGFSHWKGKAPAGLFGLRQAPAALRRKTVLESPVAGFIHIPSVQAKRDDCVMRSHVS